MHILNWSASPRAGFWVTGETILTDEAQVQITQEF